MCLFDTSCLTVDMSASLMLITKPLESSSRTGAFL